MTIEYKVCIGCGENKILSKELFNIRGYSKDGFRTFCKMCSTKEKRERLKDTLIPNLLSMGYRQILSHPQYLIGEDARVYDTQQMQYVKTHLASKGYLECSLYSEDGVSRGFYLHRLMYETFMGEGDYYRPTVSFKDGDRLNCVLSNLCVSEHPLIAKSTAGNVSGQNVRGRSRSVHHTLMRRINNGYGTVCKDWKDFETFHSWYAKHSIPQWHMEKDILVKGNKHYCPDTVCFVPRKLNNFFSNLLPPKLKYISKKGRTPLAGRDFFPCIDLKLGGVKYRLTGEDSVEQSYLLKELYLEKLVWEMKEEHKKLCAKYPSTPQISPKLLSILENFSAKEYLHNVKLT